jgi:hypothetical protein
MLSKTASQIEHKNEKTMETRKKSSSNSIGSKPFFKKPLRVRSVQALSENLGFSAGNPLYMTFVHGYVKQFIIIRKCNQAGAGSPLKKSLTDSRNRQIDAAGTLHHINFCGIDGRNIFSDNTDRDAFARYPRQVLLEMQADYPSTVLSCATCCVEGILH